MPKPRKRTEVPAAFKRKLSKEELDAAKKFFREKLGVTETPKFKGKKVHRIVRFPSKEKMVELVAIEAGIPKGERQGLGATVWKAKELLSTTHLGKEDIVKKLQAEKPKNKKETRRIVDAVDEVFNLRPEKTGKGVGGLGVPYREIRMLAKMRGLAPLTSYAAVARRLGIRYRYLHRIDSAYNRMFGLRFPGFGPLWGHSIHRLNRLFFRIKYLKEKKTTAAREEGLSADYLSRKKYLSERGYEEFARAIEESSQFKNYTKRVLGKKKELDELTGQKISLTTAMETLEMDIFEKRKRINKRNLERIRSGELDSMDYMKGIRLIYHVMQFYFDFLGKIPEDIVRRVEKFVEKNKKKLPKTVLRKEPSGRVRFATTQ